MEETVHVIEEIDSSHLPNMVDIDSTHNISEMIDPDTAASMHSISSIHLDPSSSQHISGLVDPDSTNLASMVTQDARHHITSLIIPGSGLSVLSAMDPATLSEMVSAAHPVALVTGDPGHGMDLVSADGVNANLSLVGDEVCEQMIHRSAVLDDSDEGHGKLTTDKITLHITSGKPFRSTYRRLTLHSTLK